MNSRDATTISDDSTSCNMVPLLAAEVFLVMHKAHNNKQWHCAYTSDKITTIYYKVDSISSFTSIDDTAEEVNDHSL